MLLDFDWAGKENEVCYPIRVNHEGIKRPEGAQDNKPIKKDHDTFMLNEMFNTS
jgi:hypothetical protein